jgi:hypothetical protein
MTTQAPPPPRDDEWGDGAHEPRPEVVSTDLFAYQRYTFFKVFQLRVLLALCGFIVVLATLDYLFKSSHLKDVLPLVIPLFTFVIGYATRPESN